MTRNSGVNNYEKKIKRVYDVHIIRYECLKEEIEIVLADERPKC